MFMTELPVKGVMFKLSQDGDLIKVSWVFQEKEHSVTGKTVTEAVENAMVAVGALVQQGGLI